MDKNDIELSLKSINIWTPMNWKLIKVKDSKLVKDDRIYMMQIGNNGEKPLYEFISKGYFDKVLTGRYIYQYIDNKLYLINSNNEIFSPIEGVKLTEADLPNTIKNSPLCLKFKK